MSRNKKTSESLFQFMNLLIALLLKNGQYRTSLHYKASLNSFKRYRDNKDIALKEIDAEVMRHMIEETKKRGKQGLILTCKDRLIGFYETFGYRNLGVSESVHGGAVWYDMILELEA